MTIRLKTQALTLQCCHVRHYAWQFSGGVNFFQNIFLTLRKKCFLFYSPYKARPVFLPDSNILYLLHRNSCFAESLMPCCMVMLAVGKMPASTEKFKFSPTKEGKEDIWRISPGRGGSRGKKFRKLDKMFHDMIRLKCYSPPPTRVNTKAQYYATFH